MTPGEIPISDAANICKKRQCAYVVVFGVRADGERFCVATYGKTKALCKVAGTIGDQVAESVLNGKVRAPEAEPPDTIRDVLRGCPHCEYDEAEGGLINHCDMCCRKITSMIWQHFHE